MLERDPWEPVENYKGSDSPLAANEDADRPSNRYPENGRRKVKREGFPSEASDD